MRRMRKETSVIPGNRHDNTYTWWQKPENRIMVYGAVALFLGISIVMFVQGYW
jgi:hypothetical protein